MTLILTQPSLRSLARRARSVLAAASHLEIGIMSMRRVVLRHTVDVQGNLILPAEAVAGACLEHLHTSVESPLLDVIAIDVSPIPQAHRLRGQLRLSGRAKLLTTSLPDDAATYLGVAPHDPVAVLTPQSAWITCDGVETKVPIELFRAARPDVLAGWESGWMRHLYEDHSEELRAIAARLCELSPHDVVRPLRADETGLTLRMYRGDQVHDVAAIFPTLARCGCEAVQAYTALVGDDGVGCG